MVKYFEYAHKFHVGQLPGRHYAFAGIQAPGINIFFTVYFLATGLHAFHVIVGMSVLVWMLLRVRKGSIRPSTTSRSSWGRSTGTSSTWSGSFSSPCFI